MTRATCGALAVGVSLPLLGACSHTTPYHRDPVISTTTPTADDDVTLRILLIGDAGEPQPTEPMLDSLRRWTRTAPERTLVVFLGDNAYPEGVTSARRENATRRLRRQLDAVGDAAAVFVPGNHDWANGGSAGHAAVMRQEAIVEPEASFLPSGGCPGPDILDLPTAGPPAARLIALDTQWWLHDHEKPTRECARPTPALVPLAGSRFALSAAPLARVSQRPESHRRG